MNAGPQTTRRARETTTNIRSSHTEKETWAEAALEAGHSWRLNGEPRGNVSKWLRELGNREVKRMKRRK